MSGVDHSNVKASIAKKGKNVGSIQPGEIRNFMTSKVSHDSNERAFRNTFGLVKAFTSKLNRESAQAAKLKINRHVLFMKLMQYQNI